MKKTRRDFLRTAGIAGAGIAGSDLFGYKNFFMKDISLRSGADMVADDPGVNLIGAYGKWLSERGAGRLPGFSFRNPGYTDPDSWRKQAHEAFTKRLDMIVVKDKPVVTKKKEYTFDGLHIEELEWEMPYGRPVQAILLKPENTGGRLPGILAFHDHGGNKYFGTRKITRTSDQQHPLMAEHQKSYYEGRAWANEIAKRGYVVLVHDAFAFGSRRVMLQDVPASIRQKLTDENPEDPKNIEAYNRWAAEHEHIMAKSLFSAGTTWPGAFLAEDLKALEVLESRSDVDLQRLGCAGLSGGGLRTVFMGGYTQKIKCAVCVGFMSTWNDFLLNKSFTHTWMTYVPGLPGDLDFPEILGLRAPLPALVLNDSEDQLFTIGEMKKADSILAEVYGKAGASENYRCSFHPGPHKFDKSMQEEAFAWFDKWLKQAS